MSSADIEKEILGLRNKLGTLQERYDAVLDAKTYYVDHIDDAVEAYNKKIRKTDEKFFEGFSGFSNAAVISADIDGLKEGYLDTDNTYYAIRDNLDKELTRCSTEIGNLKTQIRKKQQKLEEAREQERLEEEEKGGVHNVYV